MRNRKPNSHYVKETSLGHIVAIINPNVRRFIIGRIGFNVNKCVACHSIICQGYKLTTMMKNCKLNLLGKSYIIHTNINSNSLDKTSLYIRHYLGKMKEIE